MDEYQKRKTAIDRYNSGETITAIVKSLDKSRQWFYNWLARYKSGSNNWYVNESKVPKHKPGKISSKVEQLVLNTRKRLQTQPFSQIGAITIQYEINKQGLEPPPVWTINRIIARHGLNKSVPRQKQTKDYPDLFIHAHQMDLVGPRYLKGDGCFYSVNIIDTLCRLCYIKPVRNKSSKNILEALVECWQTQGMPDALQMDNELAFRGSNRYPRSFGSVIRFALSQNIAPVFIPIKEPWRNGIIERFNSTYDKRFLRSMVFNDFNHLDQSSKEFIVFHNSKHRYSTLNNKTPDEAAAKQILIPDLYSCSVHTLRKIPLETGSIYFVRFIRSDLKLHLPTESFKLKDTLKYSYVVAEVNIDNQCLIVRQNNQIMHLFPYRTPVDW